MKSNLPFSVETPDQSMGFLLWQTTTIWQRSIKKSLEPYEVTHAQFVLMAILLWHQGKNIDLTQVDLVNLSKLDKMTVSNSCKKLSSLDLVSRQENQEDTRAKNISLTKKGRALAKKLVPIIETVDKDFFRSLKQSEQKNLLGLFKKVLVKE